MKDFYGSAGKIWALKRIQNACKLNLTVSAGQHGVVCDGTRAVEQASKGLTKLKTLVLSTLSRNGTWQSAYKKLSLHLNPDRMSGHSTIAFG